MTKKLTIIISIILMIISVSAEVLIPEREFKSFFTGVIFGYGISLLFKAIFKMKTEN